MLSVLMSVPLMGRREIEASTILPARAGGRADATIPPPPSGALALPRSGHSQHPKLSHGYGFKRYRSLDALLDPVKHRRSGGAEHRIRWFSSPTPCVGRGTMKMPLKLTCCVIEDLGGAGAPVSPSLPLGVLATVVANDQSGR